MSAITEPAAPPARYPLHCALSIRLLDSTFSHRLLLAAYCSGLFFYGLNTGCFYRTEALRAIVAREFLQTGNWVVPTLYGEPLLTKPPGHYAAIALASLPGGSVTEWSARLPSVVAACGTVCLFYGWFGRIFGRRAGLIAALIVPASVMWFERVPSAEIDMLQVAWVVAAFFCAYRAIEPDDEAMVTIRAQWQWWIGALVCVAGGLLTKGTSPLFFYGTLLPYLWWRGRLRLLIAVPHLAGVAVAALLVGAWIGAVVWCVGWERFFDAVCQEVLPKFLPGQRDRGYPWAEIGLLPVRFLAANLPWSGFALVMLWPAVSRAWAAESKRLLVFFHCWLWPNLFFWSLVPNHAPRHSFPLAPAVAGLAALFLVQIQPAQLRGPSRWLSSRRLLFVVIGAFLIAKVYFVAAIVPERTTKRNPVEKGHFLAAMVPPATTLNLFAVKDEGIMFYYDRPVRRFRNPTALPRTDELMYCIITEAEWWQWHEVTSGTTLHELRDEQGALLLLVRLRFEPALMKTTVSLPPARRTAVW